MKQDTSGFDIKTAKFNGLPFKNVKKNYFKSNLRQSDQTNVSRYRW